MEALYRVRDWNISFENNRTRELKRLDYVIVPNRQDADAYAELLDHPEGASHLGAWLALLQVASRCGIRGTLLRDGGGAHTANTLARITRIPSTTLESALPRLAAIGWLDVIHPELSNMQDAAEKPQAGATSPQVDAEIPQDTDASRARSEREGIGRRGKEDCRRTAPQDTATSFDEWAEAVVHRHPKPKNRVLSMQALVRISINPQFDRSEFDRVHALWCETTAWREKAGNFAPVLAEWIEDRGYLKPPPPEPSTSRRLAPDDSWTQDLQREFDAA